MLNINDGLSVDDRIDIIKFIQKLNPVDGKYQVHHDNKNIASEQHYLNGNLHRIDGPAFTIYDMYGELTEEEYYLFGHEITKKQFYTPGFIDSFILENS
jgi:hypothetical protein